MNTDQKTTVTKYTLVPAEPAPNGAKTLKQTAGAYMESMKAPKSRKEYLHAISGALGCLVSEIGGVPMEKVTTVRGALLRRKHPRRGFALARAKEFLNWSRTNGDLPRHLPSPADGLSFQEQEKLPCQGQPEIQKLVDHVPSAEVGLMLRMIAIRGIPARALGLLCWGDVPPSTVAV